MSAGTSVSGGIGGIFYVLLLMYGLITRIYQRNNKDERNSSIMEETRRRRRFARIIPIFAIVTVIVVIVLNLENFGMFSSLGSSSSMPQIMISEIQDTFTNHAITINGKYVLLPLLSGDGPRG